MHFINSLLPSAHHFGFFGYWVVLFFSLVEAVPFIGFIIPGGTIVMIFGYLSSKGFFNFNTLVWFATVGAILGDNIGYYLGGKGIKFFKYENRFLKLSHLEKGNAFFKKHGNKSIFLARFVGPIRPIVPFVAGLSKMDKKKFLFWNVFSALCWALISVSIGYFFGGALKTIEVWSTRGGIFILISSVILFFLWLILKNIHKFFAFIKTILDLLSEVISENKYYKEFARKYPGIILFMKQRVGKKRFSGLPITLIVLSSLYALFCFAKISYGVIVGNAIVSADMRVENLLYSFRDPLLTKIFLWITLLGKWEIVAGVLILSCIFLLISKRKSFILPLLMSVSGCQLLVFIAKMLIHRSRPAGIIPFYLEKTYSFPSAHSAVAISLYCFLAYVAIRNFKRWSGKINIFFLAIVVVFLLGLSRLYLGVHFYSDVIGGYLLGLFWLIISIGISEWFLARKRPAQNQNI